MEEINVLYVDKMKKESVDHLRNNLIDYSHVFTHNNYLCNIFFSNGEYISTYSYIQSYNYSSQIHYTYSCISEINIPEVKTFTVIENNIKIFKDNVVIPDKDSCFLSLSYIKKKLIDHIDSIELKLCQNLDKIKVMYKDNIIIEESIDKLKEFVENNYEHIFIYNGMKCKLKYNEKLGVFNCESITRNYINVNQFNNYVSYFYEKNIANCMFNIDESVFKSPECVIQEMKNKITI